MTFPRGTIHAKRERKRLRRLKQIRGRLKQIRGRLKAHGTKSLPAHVLDDQKAAREIKETRRAKRAKNDAFDREDIRWI